ncbi:MAG: hypothetical protein J1F65_03145 [Clostridiales bacterium]|nr:hypothetical protein [Clostridiales bacterium]
MSKWKIVKPREKKEKKVEKIGAETKRRKKFPFLSVVIVLLICAVALAWALPNLPVKPQQQAPATYKGIIELWNVETFEGGVGSRESWFINKSAKFEQVHTGLFVHVTTLSVEQLTDKLQNGENFDLITFSRGVGVLVKDKLAPVTENMGFVNENFLVAGQIGGAQYALPVYSGAYCLFARTEQLTADQLVSSALTKTHTRKIGKNTVELQPLVTGFTPYNSPLTALALAGGKGTAKVSEEVTQYQAYEQFVGNRTAVTLLGTQRDMYRLSQRESNGKIEQLSFAPLTDYTDLVQYVGISANSGDKTDACVAYVKYLLSEECQSTLVNLSLFSVLQTNFYTLDRYAECERALATAYVPNAFGDADAIAQQRETALSTLLM